MKKLAVLLLLALFLIVSAIALWIQAPLIQKDLEHRVNLTLQEAEESQLVTATASGRFVSLNGTVGNDASRVLVSSSVKNVFGGLKVRQALGLLSVADPYAFSIEKHSNGKVTLSGFAENKTIRQNLIDHANKLFGRENVSAELKLAAGMPDTTWPSMAQRGMDAMDKVIFGEATLQDRRLSVSGVAESFTFVDLAKETVTGGLPEAYQRQGGVLDIRWQPPMVQPYSLQFSKQDENGGVRIQGVRPDQNFEQRLIGVVEQDQPVNIVELEDARGEPDGNWSNVVESVAVIPGKLLRGRVLVSDTNVSVTGVVSKQRDALDIEKILVELPKPYVGQAEIGVLPPVVSPFELSLNKGQTGIALEGVVPDTATAESLVRSLVRHSEFGAAGVGKVLTDPNQLKLARGMPDEQWRKAVGLFSGLSSDLVTGDIVLSGRALTVSGATDDEAARSRMNALLEANRLGDYTYDSSGVTVLPKRVEAPWLRASKDKMGLVTLDATYVTEAQAAELQETFSGPGVGTGLAARYTRVRTKMPADWSIRQGKVAEALIALDEGNVELTPTRLTVSGFTSLSQVDFDSRFAELEGYETAVVSLAPITTKETVGEVRDDLMLGDAPEPVSSTVQQPLVAKPPAKISAPTQDSDLELQAVAPPESALSEESLPDPVVSEPVAPELTVPAAGVAKPFTFGAPVNANGYQLPAVIGDVSLQACRLTTKQLLQEKKLVFATGSSELSNDNEQALAKLAAAMSQCISSIGVRVKIGGYTDSQGSEENNQKLSQQRADAVKSALLARGVDAAYLTTKGYGEANPVADNETSEGRAQNRRIEFEIVEN